MCSQGQNKSYKDTVKEILEDVQNDCKKGRNLSVIVAAVGVLALIAPIYISVPISDTALVATYIVFAAFIYGVFWGYKRVERNRSLRMGQLQDIMIYKDMLEDSKLDHNKALEILERTRRAEEIRKLIGADSLENSRNMFKQSK